MYPGSFTTKAFVAKIRKNYRDIRAFAVPYSNLGHALTYIKAWHVSSEHRVDTGRSRFMTVEMRVSTTWRYIENRREANMGKVIAICLGLAMLAGAATGADKALAKAKNSKTKNVTFILKNFTNPFCVNTRDGAAKAAEEAGVNLVVKLPAEGDNNDQLLQLTREAIDEGKTDVFIMFPADSYKFVPAVEMAVEADIPVIMLAANIVRPGERIYETFVAADNRLVGQTIGDELAKRMNYKGNVILMEGVPGSTNSVARMGGAAEALAKYKDIKVVASVPGLGRKGVTYRQAGKELMEKLLEIVPQVDGMFTMVDELAIGAIEAMEAAGRFDNVIVAGCDGVKTGLESVKAGKMNFTCDISPYTQGYRAMQAAIKIMAGEEVPERIVTDLFIIDQSNIDEFLK